MKKKKLVCTFSPDIGSEPTKRIQGGENLTSQLLGDPVRDNSPSLGYLGPLTAE